MNKADFDKSKIVKYTFKNCDIFHYSCKNKRKGTILLNTNYVIPNYIIFFLIGRLDNIRIREAKQIFSLHCYNNIQFEMMTPFPAPLGRCEISDVSTF